MDTKESIHYDSIEYTPSMIRFIDNDLVLFPGEDVNSIANRKLTATVNACLKELKTKGKIVCPICGTEATILRKDKTHLNDGSVGFHWAFYGIKNDSYELFTKDHVIPKSIFNPIHGGQVTFIPMCQDCNSNKGNTIEGKSIDEISHLAAVRKKELVIYENLIAPKLKKFKKEFNQDRNKVDKIKKYLIKNLTNFVCKIQKNKIIWKTYIDPINTYEFFNADLNIFQRSLFNILIKDEAYYCNEKSSKSIRNYKTLKKYQCILFDNVDKIMKMAK